MIDYYGTKDNYIHAKFSDLRKMYNFTEAFQELYPEFCKQYWQYFSGKYSSFLQPQQIVSYVEQNKLPVHFYFNMTDEPATIEEMHAYFERELATPPNLEKIAPDVWLSRATARLYRRGLSVPLLRGVWEGVERSSGNNNQEGITNSMSKQDKKQLIVIYSLVAVLAVVSLLVWSGVFGSPKYQKDAQTSPQTSSRPNWFSESDMATTDAVELTSVTSADNLKSILVGGRVIKPALSGSTNQSSSFDGNFTSQPSGLNLRDDLKLDTWTNNPQF